MIEVKKWSDSDYESMSWHDNHVHGIQIQDGEFGMGKLTFHLDYILEWLKCSERQFVFRIAPAALTFTEVYDLVVHLDYERPGAALTPFCISNIGRKAVMLPTGNQQWDWTIGVNWPEGEITFKVTGFTQTLTGTTVETDQQLLTQEQRITAKKCLIG